VLRRGLVYSTPVPMKKAGPHHVRVVIRDANTQKLGSAMQYVDVPDLKSGRLALSGLVMTAVPSKAGENSREDIDGTPAVRIFKSGSGIAYAYEILNASAQLETQMRLYRDGQPVYAVPASRLNMDGQQNANRFAVGGRMELTRMPPGHYVLQIVVSDSLRKDKNRIAAQSMDFEVQD